MFWYNVYVKFENASIAKTQDCMIDVISDDNLTTPEIKEKAREKARRLFGNMVTFTEIRILN